eukprot:2702449-Prymnesium_polylepis.1
MDKDERTAVPTTRRRANGQEAPDFASGQAKPSGVDCVGLLNREGAAVKHLRVGTEVAAHVGADAIGPVRKAQVPRGGGRVDRPVERSVEIAVQQRRELEKLRPVLSHVAARSGFADCRPHAADLGEGTVRFGDSRIPVALRRLMQILHLKVVTLVDARHHAKPRVVIAVPQRCRAASDQPFRQCLRLWKMGE